MHHTHSRIYSSALNLVDLAKVVLDQLPQGYGFLADQLRRAAASVPLNFAEGCGKLSLRDRQRYFRAAKGSAYEVAAVLDVAARFGVVSTGTRTQGHDLCDHLGAMLSKYK
jgi:four helix bundle protein